MASRSVDVSEFLDPLPFTSYQVLIGILCFCCTLFDGFDMSLIGLAIPKIADFLRVKPQALGLAISAGQLGPLVGAALLGMLADRFGRKKMLVLCALGFGFFTLLCTTLTTPFELAVYRFLAGLGMGGAVPAAIALGAEYAPARSRATLATAMFAGIPAGGIVSGFLAVYLLTHFGWQSLFVVGGVVPIIIALLMAAFLPESMTYTVRRRAGGQAKVRRIVGRIAPALAKDENIEFCSMQTRRAGVPVKHLFLQGRATTTILLWICFFIGFYLTGLMVVWAPTLLRKSGATPQQYSAAFGCLQIGAFLATITYGRLMDKFRSNPYLILEIAFVLGFVSLSAFGYFAGSGFMTVAFLSVANGIFINATTLGMVGIVALAYPTDITSTAVGWCYAVGRGFGMTIAPLAIAFFLGLNWSVFQICWTNAIGQLVVAALIAGLAAHVVRSRRAAVKQEEACKAG